MVCDNIKMDTKIPTVTEKTDDGVKYAADLDQALSVAGTGCYNLKYSFVLALFLVAAIVEPVGYSYVLPAAKCDLELNDALRGFIASIPYIGIVLTSYPWGYLIDTQGRKRVVVFSSMLAGIFSVLSAFMPEQISFIVCKFISSLCIAGPAAVPYSFIGEIIPPKNRDLTLSVVNAMQISGSALVPMFAWAILPLDFRIDFGLYEFRPWRLLVIVNALIFIIAAVLMSFGPESPKYLVSQGKHDEAMKVLQTIYAGNKRKSPEDYPVKRLQMPDVKQKGSFLNSLKVQSLPLLKPPYVKWVCLNGFLLFGIFSVLNGLYVWIPDIINRVFTGDNNGLTPCQIIELRLNETVIGGQCIDTIEISTFVINVIANTACAVIALAGSSTVKIVGKKNLLIFVLSVIGAFAILVNFITTDWLYAALLSSFPIMGLAIGPVNAYAVDIFPTQLRGMAISLAMMIGRLGSVMGANVAGLLLNASCETTFYLFGGLLLICAVSALFLPKKEPKKVDAVTITTRL